MLRAPGHDKAGYISTFLVYNIKPQQMNLNLRMVFDGTSHTKQKSVQNLTAFWRKEET